MPPFDHDLFVLGGGSGGVRAARVAAQHGARTAIAEEYRFGGTCVVRGCIPKKLFVYAAEVKRELQDARGFGWTVADATFSWPALRDRKDQEIDRLHRVYLDLLRKSGVELFHERAQLDDPHTVVVGDKRVTAKHILIATGGRPFLPPVPGMEHAISSNEVFHLETLPKEIAIVGGGYIAVEFAGILAAFGCQVTLIYRRPKLLYGFDEDVRDHVALGLAQHGVTLASAEQVSAIHKDASGRLRLTLTSGGQKLVDELLCAAGRTPNTQGLGLEKAGVTLDARGAVVVDAYSRTHIPHIGAVGDVTDRLQLTPVAIREGQAWADTMFGDRPTAIDHDLVPSAVFAQPPAATCGLTEERARERFGAIDVYRSVFRPLKHTLSERDEKTMMKLIVDKASQRVVGAHMVGDGAPDMMQMFAVALKMGLSKAQLDATVALHPTSAEEWVLLRTPVAG